MQRDETPEMVAEIGAAAEVALDEGLDGRGREQTGAAHRCGAERFEQQRAERAAKPFLGGNVETFLGALQNGRRQFLANERAQNALGCAGADFESRGQLRGELDRKAHV